MRVTMAQNQLRIKITWGEVSIELEGNLSSQEVNVTLPNTQTDNSIPTINVTFDAPSTAETPVLTNTTSPQEQPVSSNQPVRIDFEGSYPKFVPPVPPPLP